MTDIIWLDDSGTRFPPLDNALREPDGLLAAGGLLTPERLINAYRSGIFPWYSDEQPILWWSPDPRCVLFPGRVKISRSLKKTLGKKPFKITTDTSFREVMRACALPRETQQGTWITDEMLDAYCELHAMGYAHSAECWQDGELVGGLYGIAMGKMFFGESMFSTKNDASKVALVYLCQNLVAMDYQLIDVQVHSEHMESLGAEMIPRSRFVKYLGEWCGDGNIGQWR